jgi:hypothetical protein
MTEGDSNYILVSFIQADHCLLNIEAQNFARGRQSSFFSFSQTVYKPSCSFSGPHQRSYSEVLGEMKCTYSILNTNRTLFERHGPCTSELFVVRIGIQLYSINYRVSSS